MGALNRGALIREALELAGDTSLTPRVEVILNAALARIYSAAPWPFVVRRLGPVTGTVGSNTLPDMSQYGLFGQRIHDVLKIFWFDPRNGGNGELELKRIVDPSVEPMFKLNSGRPVQNGRPTKAILENSNSDPGAWGWSVEFDVPLDQPYMFVVVAHTIPPNLMDNNLFPIYPNDMTILQAIKLYALEHQSDERWVAEDQKLENLLRQDRVTYLKVGQVDGTIPLSNRFTKSRR